MRCRSRKSNGNSNWNGLRRDSKTSIRSRNTRRTASRNCARFTPATLASPPDVIAQEKTFELPMENNVVLTGRMDQVNRIAPGEEEIVDYKTGKPRNEEKAKKDVQLSVYALAAREVFDWNPARLTLHYLQNNQAVSATRDDKQLKQSARGNSGSRCRHSRRQFPAEARLLRAGSAITSPSAPRGSRARRPALPAKSSRLLRARNDYPEQSRRNKNGAPRFCRAPRLETFPWTCLGDLRFLLGLRAFAP